MPLLLQLSVSLQSNVQVELSFKLRVRDRTDRVKYPIDRTQDEIRERGLPEALAARLAEGL